MEGLSGPGVGVWGQVVEPSEMRSPTCNRKLNPRRTNQNFIARISDLQHRGLS